MSSNSLRTAGRAARLSLLLTLAVAVLALAGCGGGGGDTDTVLAEVGDHEITVRDYELYLSKLVPEELPRDAAGEIMDMSSRDGKTAFLNVIINKELMAAKAVDMGFRNEESVSQMEEAMLARYAGKRMHEELIAASPADITDAEVDHYYEMQKSPRLCKFMICNFEDDAVEARRRVLAGELWEDVAEDLNDGSKGPTGEYMLELKWGQSEDTYEDVVFNLELGEVSEPFDTVYGWWILRLERINEADIAVPDEAMRERIRATLAGRKTQLAAKRFMAESREKHDAFLDEAVLWVLFNGLPEGEEIMDPATGKPMTRENLAPLNIPAHELDRALYSVRFDLDSEPEVWTLGDYKAQFDMWNVFQRPKRNTLLGGVRKKIVEEMIETPLLESESRERGYYDHPDVVGEVEMVVERAIVERLHAEVVTFDEAISPEQLDAFWAEHSGEYMMPEKRTGRLVITAGQAEALEAAELARAGDWDAVLQRYSVVPRLTESGGELAVAENTVGPLRDTLFSLTDSGEISAPFVFQNGWAVVRLDGIEEPVPMTLDEARNTVGRRIKAIRKDEALDRLLEQWRLEYDVTVHEDVLDHLKSWEQVTTAS